MTDTGYEILDTSAVEDCITIEYDDSKQDYAFDFYFTITVTLAVTTEKTTSITTGLYEVYTGTLVIE